MSEDFSAMQLDKDQTKKEPDQGKNVMNAQLINKILGNNKKKKVLPLKRAHKVLLPPCLVYVSNASQTILKVPPAFSFDRCFLKPRTREVRFCGCGQIAKYRQPKSFIPYCSLPCFKNLLQIS